METWLKFKLVIMDYVYLFIYLFIYLIAFYTHKGQAIQ
jgi:hypothetical protein